MTTSRGYNFLYITCKNKPEAVKIGEALVKEKLAACANIIDSMNSIYRWENKIQYDKETVLILKTRSALVRKLIRKVKELHSYTCPCIVSLPITDGNKEYLDWIKKETGL